MDNPIKICDTVDSDIFANSIKRYISDVKNSRLRQELPISIKDRVILPFLRGFYFHETWHMRSFAKINSSRKFQNLQYMIGNSELAEPENSMLFHFSFI